MGTDRKLWLEQSVNGLFGAVPPPRQQVDANVEDFQPLDGETIYVLGTDGKLWLEHAPFNNIPPKREQVDGNVAGFQALSATVVYAWHGWKFVA
jgi:hypothetical protein